MNISWLQRIENVVGRDNLELAGAASFLLLALLVFFWPAIFGGRVLLPADLIFDLDPLWRPLAPEGYTGPSNSLLADQVYQFYPWEIFARRTLAKGQLPLWNPYTDGGTPFIGNAQSAVFSPFTLVGYLFPLHSSHVVTAVLRLFVAGIFTFLFAREINIGFPGALLTMVTFTFSGPMVVWLGHPHSFVIAWLPAILFTTERALTTKSAKYVAFSALTIGAQFLGGHPETSFHVMLAWAAYALYRIISLEGWQPSQWLPHFMRIAASALTGALLAAVQLLPFAEALLHSATLSARATDASLHTSSLIARFLFDWHEWPTAITALLPQYFGTPIDGSYWFPYSNYVEQNAYVGLLPLSLAITVVFHSLRQSSPHRKRVLFFALMTVACLGIALRLPVLSAINHLPIFNIAANGRLRLIYSFAVAVLAGLGLDEITQRKQAYYRTVLRVLGLMALIGLLLIALAYVGFTVFKGEVIHSGRNFMEANQDNPYFSRPLEYYYALVEERYEKKLALFHPSNIVMYLPVLTAFCWFALLQVSQRRRFSIKIWICTALFMTLSDSFLVGMPFNPTVAPQHIFPVPEAIQFLKQDHDTYRVSATDLILNPNSNMVFGIPDIRGYDTVASRRYTNLVDHLRGHYRLHFHSLFTQADSPLWDLLNVKYVLTDQELGGKWKLTYQDAGNVKVYRNRDVLPRAFITYRAEIVNDAAQSLERVMASGFNFRESVVLEEKPAGWTEPAKAPDSAATVHITSYQANRVTVEVETPADGLLVLTDTYAPGWKASLDGDPVSLHIANHAFRAVVVPAGSHLIEFVYRPSIFYLGAILSLLTLTVIGAVLLPLRLKRADRLD